MIPALGSVVATPEEVQPGEFAPTVDPFAWPPVRYSCPKHGMHRDWMQFFWGQRAGSSDLFCVRCFADHLGDVLPGVVTVPVVPQPPEPP